MKHLFSIILLTLCALSYLTQNYLDSFHTQIQTAKLEYQQNLVDQQVQLAGLVHELSARNTLHQNLNWGLENSTLKNLETALRPGELESVALFDWNCATVAGASLSNSSKKPGCKRDQRSRWSATPKPTYTVYLPFETEGKRFIIAGSTTINAIKSSHKSLKLRVGRAESGDTVLMREGLSDNVYFASLLSSHPLLRLVPSLSFKRNFVFDTIFWLALVTLIIFQIAQALVSSWQKNSETKQFSQFTKWLKDETNSAEPAINLREAQNHIQQYLLNQTQKNIDLKSQIEGLRSQLIDQSALLKKIDQENEVSAPLSSIATQILHLIGSTNEQLSKIESGIDDVIDINAHTTRRNLNTLEAIFTEWQREIERRGAHRFLRSLAEQQTDDGRSKLDGQIEYITRVLEDMRDVLLNLGVQLNTLKKGFSEPRGILKHWAEHANGYPNPNSTSAIDVILYGQKLFNEYNPNCTFDNRGIEFAETLNSNAPRSIWSSALFHVYSYFASEEKEVTLVTKLVHKNDQDCLVISCSGGGSTDPSSFKLAKTLVASYGIDLSVIQTPDGFAPVSMSWTRALSATVERQPDAFTL